MNKINEAFQNIGRRSFIPLKDRERAALDIALPIGYNQTISQPSTVRSMLEWLDVQPGERVMDVGSGSGWTSALLCYLVGENGRVDAVELVPELVAFGEKNCQKLGFTNIQFHKAKKGELGLKEFGPYDRILVSAAAEYLPEELMQQLKPSGKIVLPVHNDILEVTLDDGNACKISTHPGYVFVPLIEQ